MRSDCRSAALPNACPVAHLLSTSAQIACLSPFALSWARTKTDSSSVGPRSKDHHDWEAHRKEHALKYRTRCFLGVKDACQESGC
jgi:hypothetical protein